MLNASLRPYQQTAVDTCRQLLRECQYGVILSSFVGSGKTRMASHVVRAAALEGQRVLVLAHLGELIDQLTDTLLSVGVVTGSAVQVGTIQSLRRRHLTAPDLVVVDEAHHVTEANSYGKLLQSLRERNPRLRVLGLSATPWRLDGKGLLKAPLFDRYHVAITPSELLESNFLVPVRGYAYRQIDTAGLKSRAGEYETKALTARASNRTILGDIVGEWQRHCAGHRTLCFCVSAEHARDLADAFKAGGVRSEFLLGTDDAAKRASVFSRLERRDIEVLCNVAIATEGVDLPWLEALILARPTLSEALALQMYGRGLRTAPGKTHCRIHDHAGVIFKHGLPYDERSFEPTEDKARKGGGGGAQKVCKGCLAIVSASCRSCPYCGEELMPPSALTVDTTNVETVDITTISPRAAPVAPPRVVGIEVCGPFGTRQVFKLEKEGQTLTGVYEGSHVVDRYSYKETLHMFDGGRAVVGRTDLDRKLQSGHKGQLVTVKLSQVHLLAGKAKKFFRFHVSTSNQAGNLTPEELAILRAAP